VVGHGSGLLLHLTKGPCDWYYAGDWSITAANQNGNMGVSSCYGSDIVGTHWQPLPADLAVSC
jgi:hypothetical protein